MTSLNCREHFWWWLPTDPNHRQAWKKYGDGKRHWLCAICANHDGEKEESEVNKTTISFTGGPLMAREIAALAIVERFRFLCVPVGDKDNFTIFVTPAVGDWLKTRITNAMIGQEEPE